MRTTRYVIAAVAVGVIGAVAFAAGAGAEPAAKQATQLSGAGSSFVAPLIGQWINNYRDASIVYNPVGSGAGIAAIKNRTVDFGASDAPMTVDQFTNSPRLRDAPLGAVRIGHPLQPAGRQEQHPPDRPACSPTSTSARSRSGTTRRSRS